eukprot:Sspe_Gene.52170::Locus_28909_Transcript_1_1_Confidence_1.000_Length_948::g.52170::m.52170
MGFWLLLGANMAVAGTVAGVADVLTQRMEMHFTNKRRENFVQAMSPNTPMPSSDSSFSLRRRPSTLDHIANEMPPLIAGDDVRFLCTIDLEDGTVVEKGDTGMVTKVPGDAKFSVAEVVVNDTFVDVFAEEVERLVQEYSPSRTFRMVVVASCVFDPLSFVWYYAILPTIVPGTQGNLSAHQMLRKIFWDVVVYGGVVSTISITANAAMQKPECQHIATRLSSDLPLLYFTAMALSVPVDVPVFILVHPAWQSAVFKFLDAIFMFIVSYVVNRRLDVIPEDLPKPPRLIRD